ncbi:hypothetical protein GY14_03620 [Delftia tsuruhatensis]|nr:hypothetical protein GY14_03620 [Delftia tsuruhatensis]
MRADADDDQHFGLDRAGLVHRIGRRELFRVALGLGIGQLAVQFGQLLDLVRRALDDPDGLAAPLDRELLAVLEGGDIDLHCSPGGFGLLGWLEGAHERDAVATPPTAPAHADVMIHVRLLESIGVSLMGFLELRRLSWGQQ